MFPRSSLLMFSLSSLFLATASQAEVFLDAASVESSSHSFGLGIGSIANENAAGQSPLVSTSNPLPTSISVTGEYTYSPGEVEIDEIFDDNIKEDIIISGYKAIGLIPLGRIGGARYPSGFGLTASQSTLEVKSGFQDSKSRQAIDRFSAMGSVGVGIFNFGLSAVMFTENRKSESHYSYTSSQSLRNVQSQDSSKVDYSNLRVGAGVELNSSARLALNYAPRQTKWYKEDSERHETVVATGIVTREERKDLESTGDDQELAVGAQFSPNRAVKIMPGVARQFPHSETREEQDGTRTIRDTHSTDGSTTWSLGGEYGSSRKLAPFGAVQYARLENATMRGISLGASSSPAAASALTLGLSGGYRVLNNDSDRSSVTLRQWTGIFSFGGHF